MSPSRARTAIWATATCFAANENPTKLAPCVAPQSGELITWTATDTTLKADVFLSAPAVVHYVLLRHDAPAPNPTQILLGLDANGASPPCADCDFADSSSSAVAGNTSCAHDGTTIWSGTGCTLETFANLSNAVEYDLYMVTTHSNATAVASDNTGPTGLRFLRGVFAKPDRPGDGPRDGQRRAALLGVLPQAGGRQGHDGDTPGEAERGGHGVVRRAGGGHDDGGRRAPESRLGRFVSSLRERLGERRRGGDGVRAHRQSKKTYDAYLVAMDDEDGGDYGGNTQAAVTKRTFTAASADGHLGGVAAVTTAAAAGDFGERITAHAVQPAFDPEIFEYRTFVNVTTASVKVTLTANDTQSDGLITVNGTARAGGVAFDVPLAHGVTVLAVEVVSGDGLMTKAYTYSMRARQTTPLPTPRFPSWRSPWTTASS